MKKKEFEMVLQKIESPAKTKANLEQYMTPAKIASDILWKAYHKGDIAGKFVIDLGCGTGIFSIGASLLKAKKVIGVDIDKNLIEIAKKEAKKFGLKIKFFSMDIENFCEKGDVVIMNPPFGAQYSNRKADKKFLMKAMDVANTIYSIHLKDSIPFIKKFVKLPWNFYVLEEYKFPIKATMPFHEKKVKYYNVVAINLRKE